MEKKFPFIPLRVTSSHHHEKQREKNMLPVGSNWENANKGFYIGLLHVPEPESAMVVGERRGSVINCLQAETRKKQLNGELQ